MFRSVFLAALGLVAVQGADKMAIVRVFSTAEEVLLLQNSIAEWEALGVCADNTTTAMTDLILVYSKDLATDPNASAAVNMFETIFTSGGYGWTSCFGALRSLSARLTQEEDTYDARGSNNNRYWVMGPNTVFKSIMTAFYNGTFADEYKSFFLMEMDAVPLMGNWLDQFETEAMEMEAGNMAVRGSQYLGDKWDLFKHVMPAYLVQHINGNAIYNLKHPWTKYLYEAFTMQGDDSMMEDHAFDVAFSMVTMAAMSGSDPTFAAAWAAANGTSMTYNPSTMLVGNYANTLLNKSFEFGTYIRHGSSKNLFDAAPDNAITLGVAAYDKSTSNLMDTIPTNHPFKNIMVFTHYPVDNTTETIVAPGGNVTVTTQEAAYEPYMHLCEVARKVATPWFALTDNYHIINAPVSVLLDGNMPVLPYVTAESKYCGERPNCAASLDQANGLFGTELAFHHDTYEVLFNTTDALAFCADWETATGVNMSWADCTLSFGPTGDDYIAWKINKDMDIMAVPKDKTRYGWRAWTSLWTPAPVDNRNCTVTLYGEKEFEETLGNISACSLHVEDASGCAGDTSCMWKPMFESGVCLLDPTMIPTTTDEPTTTTTTAGEGATTTAGGGATTTAGETTSAGDATTSGADVTEPPSAAAAASVSAAAMLAALVAFS